MASETRRYEPAPPSHCERRDNFLALDERDAEEIRALRREVVEARRRRAPDQLALEDAADRTEFVVRHTLIYRVGSIVEHYGKGRLGRALERRTAGRPPVQPLAYPESLPDQYTRWFTLARRQRWDQPTRWSDDTVALVVIGTHGAEESVQSFNVQRRPTDHVTTIESGAQLPNALASISAEARPTPRWLIVLDAGDVITPDAVSWLIHFAGEGDIAYADQDEIDANGVHVNPWLKPDDLGGFSPLGHNVLGAAAIYRRSSLTDLDPSLGSGVLVDAANRLIERGPAPSHIRTVLASRPVDRASYIDADELAAASQRALERRGWGGHATRGSFPGTVEWRPSDPESWPSVQIVIPTRDRLDLLRRCVESIEKLTSYPNYEITLVDNDSIDEATLAYFTSSPYRVVRAPGPFLFPKIVNAGAAAGDEDFVLLLNNDTVVLDERWLADLVRIASLPSVGIVGSVLVGEDGRINHAGLAVSGAPCQWYYPVTAPSDNAPLHATRDVVAVTGACQLVRRELWRELGGHDETFAVECSDVDISLRARELGWRTVVVASSPLRHDEKASRGELSEDHDGPAFAYRWGIDDGFIDPHVTQLISYWPGPHFKLLGLS